MVRLAFALVVWASLLAPLAAQTALTPVPDLLDRYARGDQKVLAPFGTAEYLRHLREQLTRDADAWIRREGQQRVRQRELVAATFALEAARASYDIDWDEGKRLIQWGSSIVRRPKLPDEAERLWHLAALSVIQGATANDLLIEQQKLAWERFKSEPRFLLALVVMLEGDTWPDPDRAEPWDSNDVGLEESFQMNEARRRGQQGSRGDLREKSYEYQRRTRMRTAIMLLEDLADLAEIRAEVLLRLGFLHFRLRHSEIALEQFEEALTLTEEPFLVYLAAFLSGTIREQQGDRSNAVAAYRAALAAVPRAQAASFALATLLFLGDDRVEAAQVADQAVAPPLADDPWRSYQRGDFRFWSERLSALKKAIE